MANTISNNKISHLISSQVPFFVRDDHDKFVLFLEAYYQYLEQETKTGNRLKNVQTYNNVDLAPDDFVEKLFTNFMKFIPDTVMADRKLLIKHIKDFYRARGTEKAAKFLFRIMFNEEIDVYYPKKDILKVSDGKWYIQKSLRIQNTKIDGVLDSSLATLDKFIATMIIGANSGATAIVEKVDRFYNQGTLVDELILSNIKGNFNNNETISALFDGAETTQTISATTFGGIINALSIIDAGTNYQVGDPVVIISNTGTGACATVAQVSTGNLMAISVTDGGAGFQNGNFLLITGGGGSGANANVSVNPSGTVHPNSYNIAYSTISLEANTLIGNAKYSNLNSTIKTANANCEIGNAMSNWTYGNTGPANYIYVIDEGAGYTSSPTISIIANSRIQQLGILGKMTINNGGQNYKKGDTIEFLNGPGCYGCGALGNVHNINTAASNAISEVRFIQMPGHIIGGSGYDINYPPIANVKSATGTGANISVTALLGSGGTFTSANGIIGSIQRVTIINSGISYEDARVVMTGYGDGKANITADVLTGVYDYPGKFLNDDGFISSYNFIQDRDYYQNFSYVIKAQKSIDKYRKFLKELNHPAGMKMFGEHMLTEEEYTGIETDKNAYKNTKVIFKKKTYTKNGNTINISYTAHGVSNGTAVYLEYDTGGFNNVKNGVYTTANVTANNIRVTQLYYSSNNTSGNVFVGIAT